MTSKQEKDSRNIRSQEIKPLIKKPNRNIFGGTEPLQFAPDDWKIGFKFFSTPVIAVISVMLAIEIVGIVVIVRSVFPTEKMVRLITSMGAALVAISFLLFHLIDWLSDRKSNKKQLPK